MTICGVFAGKNGQGVPQTVVGVYADSRVTRGGGASYEDGATKIFPLANRTCVTASGRVNAFLEVFDEAREDLAAMNQTRQREGRRPTGLWEEAGCVFKSVLNKRKSRNERDPLSVLAGGFLSNGDPAIAEARFEGPRKNELHLFIPMSGEVASRVSGVARGVRLIADAVRLSVSRSCAMDALASVLHDVIVYEQLGMGVGGGISYGLCLDSDKEFSYPNVEIDGKIFRLGAMISSPVPGVARVLYKYDMTVLPALHAEDEEDPRFVGGSPAASWVADDDLCMGCEEIFINDEPSWVTDANQPAPFTNWVRAGEGNDGFGFRAWSVRRSGLHQREREAVDHHKRGVKLPPPPAEDATHPPQGHDALSWEVRMDDQPNFGPLMRSCQWDW